MVNADGPLLTLDRSALKGAIAAINGKGGVGKTTTISHLAFLLALAGYQVLTVDMDPQGNVGDDLGYNKKQLSDDGASLAAAIQFEHMRPVVLEGVRPNLDCIAGGEHLRDVAALMPSIRRRAQDGKLPAELYLARVLARQLTKQYDFILIDCPPVDTELQDLVLGAAKWVVIPYKSDLSSRNGLLAIAKRFTSMRRLNQSLELLGVFLYGTGRSATRLRQQAQGEIRRALGAVGGEQVVLESVISHLEAVAVDVRDKGLLAFELEAALEDAPPWWEALRNPNPNSDVPAPRPPASTAGGLAEDFRDLAKELIGKLLAASNRAGV